MNRTTQVEAKPTSTPSLVPVRTGLLQRRSTNQTEPSTVPPMVHEVLRSPGQPLDPATRAVMEPHFGHDFSRVRVHPDGKAAESARAVNAAAYTVGRDIVFGARRYAPESTHGQRLLGHELTHVVQQRGQAESVAGELDIARPDTSCESEADRVAESVVLGRATPTISSPNIGVRLQRQGFGEVRLAEARMEEEARKAKENLPIGKLVGAQDAEPIKGEPRDHPNYIQNVIKTVGIFGWGGPFKLDRQVVDGVGVDSIYLPRDEFHLYDDPLKGVYGTLNKLYKSRAAADAALSALGIPEMHTFYIGPGGHIYPTIISDTTAPALCEALRTIVEVERTDAKAAEKLSVDLLFWYVGARFPIKTSGETSAPRVAAGGGSAAGTAAASGGKSALVYVEIGAGDLKASIELAKKGGVKVIAVDPVAPSASAIAELEAVGGSFIKGTVESLSPGTADHVFQYFPWRIGGTGSYLTGGTWRLVEDAIKLLKPNGAAHFVTEDLATAQFLAKEASSKGLKAVLTETTAGIAAPGASGSGIPGFAGTLKAWLVNIYK